MTPSTIVIPFTRYLRTGVIVTLADLLTLYILREFADVPLLLAVFWAFLLASNLSFVLNRIWTFRNTKVSFIRQYTKFLFTSSVGLFTTLFLMWLLAERWRLFSGWTDQYYLISKFLASCVVVCWNFLTNKLWTFANLVQLHPDLHAKKEYPYFLSIIIPAYNEEKRIIPTVEAIINYILQRKLKAEILIIDDGSSDGTSWICKNRFKSIPYVQLIKLSQNQGKGSAIRAGILHSSGEYILFTDADNSTPIEEFEKFSPHLKKNTILIGSRYIQPHLVERSQPRYRVLLSRAANLLIRLFVIDEVRDTQCGFKAFPQEIGLLLARLQKVNRFAYDIELLSLAQLCGYEIQEIPVRWLNSPNSRLRPVRDAFWTFYDLLRIKMFIWRGVYGQLANDPDFQNKL